MKKLRIWVARTLRKWMREDHETQLSRADMVPVEAHGASVPQQPHCRFGVLHVMNGRVLEVCSYKPNPHGPDWSTTYWILNEEEPLAEQLAVVMTMKGLEKK
mgnify:CR=1 FL=1